MDTRIVVLTSEGESAYSQSRGELSGAPKLSSREDSMLSKLYNRSRRASSYWTLTQEGIKSRGSKGAGEVRGTIDKLVEKGYVEVEDASQATRTVDSRPLLGEVALRRWRTLFMLMGYFSGSEESAIAGKMTSDGWGSGEVKEYLDDYETKGLIEKKEGRVYLTKKGDKFHAGGLLNEEALPEWRLT